MASENDVDLCREYGSFMHALRRPEAEALYWVWFFLVLGILFGASWHFGRIMERVEHMKEGDSTRQRMLNTCFYRTVASALISLAIAVMEVFVLLALQFCSQEPLASLYWSTWTVLQVGAVVAIFGVCLHVRHMIKGRRNPPWALALGTPVLVVAGVGHYWQGKFRRKARIVGENLISRNRSLRSMSRSRSRAVSEAPTTRCTSTDGDGSPPRGTSPPITGMDGSDSYNAKIIGCTEDGDVIIRISPTIASEIRAAIRGQSGGITWEQTPMLRSPRGRTDGLSMPSIHQSASSQRQLLAPTTCVQQSTRNENEPILIPCQQNSTTLANAGVAILSPPASQGKLFAKTEAHENRTSSPTTSQAMEFNEKEAS